jgi:GT2 family glycosyltransferase
MSQDLRPDATVVLPTYGRRTSLLKVLEALALQYMPAGTFEVVVICDGDTDGSAAACEELAPRLPYTLRVLTQPNQGPAAARNRGVREAQAPLIVFLDDDVVPTDRLIALHLAAHNQDEALITIGPLLPPTDVRLSTWAAWEEAALCRQYCAMIEGRWQPTYRQFYTGNAAVRASHIRAVGGFNVAYRRAEDVELALRLRDQGLRFRFLPEATGWHYISRSFAAWLRLPAAYGAADVAMARAGWSEVLVQMAEEYRSRSPLVRLLAYLCTGRTSATDSLVAIMGILVRMASARQIRPLGYLACSLIFNTCYYDGAAKALGGRTAFRQLLRDVARARRQGEPLRVEIGPK